MPCPSFCSSLPPRSALTRRCGTNALPLQQTPRPRARGRTASWSCGSETGPCSVVGLIVASGPFLARSLVDLTCLWSRVTPGSASIRRPPGPLRLADLPLPQPARAPPAGRAGGFRCGIQRGRRWRPVSPSSWRCSSSRRSRQLVRSVASPASTRDLI